MTAKLKRVVLAAVLPLALSACVQSQSAMQLRQMSPGERAEAGKKEQNGQARVHAKGFLIVWAWQP